MLLRGSDFGPYLQREKWHLHRTVEEADQQQEADFETELTIPITGPMLMPH